jgi:hypothetical protein
MDSAMQVLFHLLAGRMDSAMQVVCISVVVLTSEASGTQQADGILCEPCAGLLQLRLSCWPHGLCHAGLFLLMVSRLVFALQIFCNSVSHAGRMNFAVQVFCTSDHILAA